VNSDKKNTITKCGNARKKLNQMIDFATAQLIE